LVAAGAGVAVLPSGVADAVRPDGVAAVPIVPALRREVGLLHRDGPLSPAAEAFVAIALDRPAPAPRRPRPRRRSSRSGGATGIERRS
jgi:DNA-binding transcriptional LysR family regulator